MSAGYVYIAQSPSLVKVGFSSNPIDRTGNLKSLSGKKCLLLTSFKSVNASMVERKAHKKLKEYRCCGELFSVSPRHAFSAISEAIKEDRAARRRIKEEKENETKTPLKKWLDENRWGIRAVARETGLSSTAVNNHAQGNTFFTEKTISKYKALGVPSPVIVAHVSWMVKKVDPCAS